MSKGNHGQDHRPAHRVCDCCCRTRQPCDGVGYTYGGSRVGRTRGRATRVGHAGEPDRGGCRDRRCNRRPRRAAVLRCRSHPGGDHRCGHRCRHRARDLASSSAVFQLRTKPLVRASGAFSLLKHLTGKAPWVIIGLQLHRVAREARHRA